MIPVRPARSFFAAFALLSIVACSIASGSADAPRAPALEATLTLDEAIRLALESNKAIKVEAYAPAIAQANWLTAVGAFDPSLNFSRNSSRGFAYPSVPEPLPSLLVDTDTYSLSLDGILPTGLNYSIGGYAENERGSSNRFTDNYLTFGGINVTQPLLRGFGFGANLANVRIARADRSISKWQYRQTLIDTVTSVITTYSNLVLAHEELRIAKLSRDLAVNLLTKNEQRLKAGDIARSDVTTARAQVALVEEAILSAENTVRSTENQLRELMGETSFLSGRPLLAIETPLPSNTAVDPATDYETALKDRPDYQAARLGITINRASDAAARNGLLPQVNLVWSYGYNGLDRNFAVSRSMVASMDFPSSAIGINLSIPITNAQGRGRARAARLQLEQSEADLKRLESDIAVAVANDASQIETTRQRVAADRTAYDLANQALGDEMKKLQAGNSTTLAVIQSQQILVGVETSVAVAEANQRQAVATYDRALGATLLRNHITLAEDK